MRKVLFFFTLLIFSSFSVSGNEVEEYVLEQHTNIFKYIKNSKDLLVTDRTNFLLGLEKISQNLIDPREISKRVLGKKNFDRASKEQRKKFDQKFKNTLFDTYSNALVEINNSNITIQKHLHPNERLDRAIVYMGVKVSDTEFNLIYKMIKIKGEWKISGIILDGIDLISIFRKQFKKLLLDSDGNLDSAIQNWEIES